MQYKKECRDKIKVIMILLTLLALASLIVGMKARYVKPRWSVLFFAISAIVFLLWFVEYKIIGNIVFWASDEIKYFEKGQSFIWSDFLNDRGLWYALNNWLLKLDIPTAGYALKFVNLFILYFILVLLSAIFREQLVFKAAILFLPYLFIIGIHNFRDMLILLLMISSVYCLTKENKSLLAGLMSLSLLVFLRPIFLGLAVLIILLAVIWDVFLEIRKGRLRLGIVGFILILLIVMGPIAYSKLSIAINRSTKNIEDGGVRLKRITEQGYASGNRARDLAIAAIRYSFTPVPTSMLQRLFAGGSDEWGIVDDFIRTWNQFGYYFLCLYLVYKWKTAILVIRKMSTAQKALLGVLTMYLPIYSMHLYGVCHQRLKLPFQMAVMITAILVWKTHRMRKSESACVSQEHKEII